MGLKLSDIRAVSLPQQQSYQWAMCLEEEFFRQVRAATVAVAVAVAWWQ